MLASDKAPRKLPRHNPPKEIPTTAVTFLGSSKKVLPEPYNQTTRPDNRGGARPVKPCAVSEDGMHRFDGARRHRGPARRLPLPCRGMPAAACGSHRCVRVPARPHLHARIRRAEYPATDDRLIVLPRHITPRTQRRSRRPTQHTGKVTRFESGPQKNAPKNRGLN